MRAHFVLTCTMLLAAATGAAAQASPQQPPQRAEVDPDTPVLLPEQDRELAAWLTAMDEWRQFDAKWTNRVARDKLGRVAARPPVPEAPAWLPAYCIDASRAGVLDLQAHTRMACRLLADPRAAVGSVPAHVKAARDDAERPAPYSKFLTRIHLDGLWTTMNNGRSYGIVGSHMSLVDVGRVQVFGPPGVLVMTVPQADGSRRIELGYTWGVSIRLSDVRLFGSKDMSLFMNVTKVWVSGGGSHDIVGLSLARRARR
jgi:hypothetical protein